MISASALDRLRDELRERHRPRGVAAGPPATFLGQSLRTGALHEWFGVDDRPCRQWSPPLCILASIASQLLETGAVTCAFWIGRSCWPYPRHLGANDALRRASVFIDPPDASTGLWAIDMALRCASPSAVIADGRGLRLAQTRRLQLAAGAGGSDRDARGGVCLLARPEREQNQLSAAATRWSVTPAPSPGAHPRWTVELLRNKDRPMLTDDRPRWAVEWDDAQGCVRVPAAVADRAGIAATATLLHAGPA